MYFFLWLFLLLCSYFLSIWYLFFYGNVICNNYFWNIIPKFNLASSIFSASFSFDFFWFSCFFFCFSVYRSFFLLFSPLSAIRCHFLSNDFNRSPSIRLEWDSVTVLNYTLYFYDVAVMLSSCFYFVPYHVSLRWTTAFDLNGCTSTQTVYFPGGVFLVFQINIPTQSERFCSARNSSHYLTGCFPKIPAWRSMRPDLRWGSASTD